VLITPAVARVTAASFVPRRVVARVGAPLEELVRNVERSGHTDKRLRKRVEVKGYPLVVDLDRSRNPSRHRASDVCRGRRRVDGRARNGCVERWVEADLFGAAEQVVHAADVPERRVVKLSDRDVLVSLYAELLATQEPDVRWVLVTTCERNYVREPESLVAREALGDERSPVPLLVTIAVRLETHRPTLTRAGRTSYHVDFPECPIRAPTSENGSGQASGAMPGNAVAKPLRATSRHRPPYRR